MSVPHLTCTVREKVDRVFGRLVQALCCFLMLSGIWIVTADQLHQFLRMHLMAVTVAGILL